MARPPKPPACDRWTTREWADWVAELDVMASVGPDDEPSCERCHRPMAPDANGTLWPRCWACNVVYKRTARAVVPISYSVSNGLTSLIAQAKDEPSRWWVRVGLASVLFNFLEDHTACLERFAFGTFDYATVVPSHPSKRGGRDHLKDLIASVEGGWPAAEVWDLDLLTKLRPSAADERRQEIHADLFEASSSWNLAGRRVLLIDDLYTSGSTTASAAVALMDAGADPPVIVTIGRQIAVDEVSRDFVRANGLGSRPLDPRICALHGRFPGHFPI